MNTLIENQPELKEKKIEVKYRSGLKWFMAEYESLTGWLNSPNFIAFEDKDGKRFCEVRKLNPDGGPALIPKYVVIAG